MPVAFIRRRHPRTIFIGDVHGCLNELRHLIKQLHLTYQDEIIMLGDLINRGPDSAGVVEFVAESGFSSLMGNHEADYLLEFQRSEKYNDLYHQLGPYLHNWLANRLLYIETDRFIAIHAGLQPDRHPSQSQKGILLNIRTWDGKGVDIRNPDNPAWYDFYHNSRPVFYGHWARAGLNLRVNTFGLDSGCVYGKKLSAYILEEKKIVQVMAEKVYYVPPSLR